ncbi:MAG: glycosyltransferase family 2 protein, partial [Acidobacteria bacterium]|nr:glycosyltransferase family 2 protein [Acidobacteriota bacterium]
MKLIIQIPALNEEKTIAKTISDLPRKIKGVDKVEVLIINDGSEDRTVEVAREAGADYVVNFDTRQGLARIFQAGLDACLQLGADIIVNTDADNQYEGQDIPKLIQPILDGEAQIVVGDRQIKGMKHFSPVKKLLQLMGSWVVRQLSNTTVTDATSGFRAYSRKAAMQINVVTEFTYTLETIIQAGKKRISISHVPIRARKVARKSRLFKNNYSYIKRSITSLIRIYTMYEPLKIFFYIGAFLGALGAFLLLRFLWFYFFTSSGHGHVQSLLFGIAFVIVGIQIFLIGLVSDLIASNRKLIEKVLLRLKSERLN